jgi:hypothetical protein
MLVNFVPREGHASEGIGQAAGRPETALEVGGRKTLVGASSAPAANLWSLNTLTDHEVQDNLRYNT